MANLSILLAPTVLVCQEELSLSILHGMNPAAVPVMVSSEPWQLLPSLNLSPITASPSQTHWGCPRTAPLIPTSPLREGWFLSQPFSMQNAWCLHLPTTFLPGNTKQRSTSCVQCLWPSASCFGVAFWDGATEWSTASPLCDPAPQRHSKVVCVPFHCK